MCKTRNSKRIKIGNKIIRVDSCIANEIKELNKMGIKTLMSCCGHGKYPKTIVVKDNKNFVFELCTGMILSVSSENRHYFYVKDRNTGYMYIPELKLRGRK